MGIEPSTNGTTIRYSNQLSYSHHLVAAKIMNYPLKMKRLVKNASDLIVPSLIPPNG